MFSRYQKATVSRRSDGFDKFVVLLLIIALAGSFSKTAVAALHGQSFVDPKSRYGLVTITARNASARELVKRLSRRLNFKIVGEVPSRSLKFNGTIKGSFSRVISRLLGRSNYMIVSNARTVKRLIIRSSRPRVKISIRKVRRISARKRIASIRRRSRRSHSFVDPRSNYRNVVIKARNVTATNILTNLARKMNFSILGNLPRRKIRITGIIKSSLGGVASRLLSGSNYIIVSKSGVAKRLHVYKSKALSKTIMLAKRTRNLLTRRRSKLLAASKRYFSMSRRMLLTVPNFAAKLAKRANNLMKIARELDRKLAR